MSATSATCPACGVAVVPGYVRCPKCQRPLPAAARRVSTVAGGTAVAGGGLPILPIVGLGIVVLGIVLYFVLGDDDKPAATGPAETASETEPEPAGPVPLPEAPDRAPADRGDPGRGDPDRLDPRVTARDLERALKNQRLWSSVEVVGRDLEVRSGSCRDANMMPTIDAARAVLNRAGVTRVRCLESNGSLVFEREL